jgi:hypothetical protein
MESWLYFSGIALVFFLLSAWSWRKWTDPLIDMGRELYVPWQITQGKALYRDIASLYGPFSSYLNALFFKYFGCSLTTIIWCNLSLLALFTVAVFRFFRKFGDRLSAAIVCLVMLCVFAFAQYLPISNYNFITPYSHEAVHGTMLAVLLLFILQRFSISGSMVTALLAGCLTGAVLLTKQEIALAAVAATGFWLLLFAVHPARPKASRLRIVLPYLAGTLLIPALFLIILALQMPVRDALGALGAMWMPLFRGELPSNIFYQTVSGFHNPGDSLKRLFLSSAKIGVLLSLIGITTMVFPLFFKNSRRTTYLTILPIAGIFILFHFGARYIGWQELARPLPLVMLFCAIGFTVLFFRRKETWNTVAPLSIAAAWAVFSLLMLAKILLNARVYHYGFYLALPATLMIVWLLVHFIPSRLSRWPERARLFRWMAIAMLAAGVVFHLQWSWKFYRLKTQYLTKGKDSFATYPGTFFPLATAEKKALDVLDSLATPGSSMVVIPEGAMINYLSRIPNPTPYLNFLPPELSYYGEDAIIASIRTACPRFIVLVRRNVSEFGESAFGISPRYGKNMLDWINEEYETITLIGSEPFTGDGAGIKIMGRRGTPSLP